MYYFPFFPDGPFSDGDVPTWNDTTKRWEAMPGGRGGSQTWAETLEEGNVSGENSPIIENEEILGFSDSESEVVVSLGLTEEDEEPLAFLRNTDDARIFRIESAGGLALSTSDATGTASDILIKGGDSEEETPGHITIMAGSANGADQGGGQVQIRSGDGGGGEVGSGGILTLKAGVPDGALIVLHENETTAIQVTGAPESVQGGATIYITENGLSFWNGTPSVRPAVTGAVDGNTALNSLLQTLHNIGLIDNQTTPT